MVDTRICFCVKQSSLSIQKGFDSNLSSSRSYPLAQVIMSHLTDLQTYIHDRENVIYYIAGVEIIIGISDVDWSYIYVATNRKKWC